MVAPVAPRSPTQCGNEIPKTLHQKVEICVSRVLHDRNEKGRKCEWEKGPRDGTKNMNEYPSDNSAGPIARGVTRRARKGWEGDDLEIEHQREAQQEPDKKRTSAAVCLDEFRNFEVGKGYQAKHVIRQRTGAANTEPIKDMTGGLPSPAPRKERNSGIIDNGEKGNERRNEYLQCEALRTFRRELDKILE
jgi:hypothetical protein